MRRASPRSLEESRDALSSTARRDLLLLATGVGVSTGGDAVALVALLLLLRDAGSGWIAALLAAQLVPVVVLSPAAGRLVDQVETRRMLLCAICGQAAVALPLAFATAPWLVVVLFTVLSGFTAAVRPATNALVPTVTGSSRAARGYARLAAGMSLGWIAGPAVGGVLTAVAGTRGAVLVDAASFVVLAGACWLLAVRRPPGKAATGTTSRRVGFSLLWRDPILRASLSISFVSVACAVIDNVAAPFRFVDQLGTSSTGFGAYLAIWGTGVLVGSQLLPRVASSDREAHATAAGNLLAGLGIAGIGLAPSLPLALMASAIGGLGNGLANVGQSTLIGQRVSESHRGRAFAANGAAIQAATGIGTAAGGPVLATLAPGTAMTVFGGLGAATAAAGLVYLRSIDRCPIERPHAAADAPQAVAGAASER